MTEELLILGVLVVLPLSNQTPFLLIADCLLHTLLPKNLSY